MGFLSDTQVTVGSQAYNLAGDPISRTDFLKTTVITSVISDAPYIGASVSTALITGPGTTYKRFASWAGTSGFNTSVGNTTASIFNKEDLSTAAFNAIVPIPVGKETKFIFSDIDAINLVYLGRQYIFANIPAKRNMAFDITYEVVTTITGNLVITFADTTVVTFTPSTSVVNTHNKQYVYVEYQERDILDSIPSPVPAWTVVDLEASLPSLADYSGSYISSINPVTLTTTTDILIEYSDGRPDETSSGSVDSIVDYDSKSGTFTKTRYLPDVTTVGYFKRDYSLVIEYYYIFDSTTDVTIATEIVDPIPPSLDPVTKTTTTTVVIVSLVPKYRYRETWVDTYSENWEESKIAVYEIGTNPVIDVLVLSGVTAVTGQYFPVIPIRKYSVFVDETNYPTQYALNKKAVKKAFGSNKLNEIIESLSESPQIAEMDHAWVVFGVSIGTQQEPGKEYIYQFFKALADSAPINPAYIREASTYSAYWEAFTIDAEGYVTAINTVSDTAPPAVPVPPQLQSFSFATTTGGGNQDWAYNVVVSASGGHRSLGTGYHIRSDSEIGKVWIYKSGVITIYVPELYNPSGLGTSLLYKVSNASIIKIGKQLTSSSWEEYEFFDVVHKNVVYDGYSVLTLGGKEIEDMNENSSFILPLNEFIFSNTSLVPRTQLALESAFIVINYYTVTEIPWYQSGIFQIVVMVVIIIVAVETGYIAGDTAGLLGANATVGATLGFAGTSAIVAGAIANAIAAGVVAMLLSEVSTAIFGEEVGRIVAFVATVAVMSWAGNGYSFDLSKALHGLTHAENLLKLTVAGVDSYSQYISGKVGNLMSETKDLMNDHEARMKEIQKLSAQFLGNTGIDSGFLADATRYIAESEKDFLGRTLMTGDDIANITLDLIENFPKSQLELKLA